MCKSILSVASSAGSSVRACGGEKTPSGLSDISQMLNIGLDDEHYRRLKPPRPAVLASQDEKHPTQSDSSPAELLYIQIKGTAPETTRPLLLKLQVYHVKRLAHAEGGQV